LPWGALLELFIHVLVLRYDMTESGRAIGRIDVLINVGTGIHDSEAAL